MSIEQENQELENFYLLQLERLTVPQLVKRFNKEVGVLVRTSGMKPYLRALNRALKQKGVNTALITKKDGSLELGKKIEVDSALNVSIK